MKCLIRNIVCHQLSASIAKYSVILSLSKYATRVINSYFGNVTKLPIPYETIMEMEQLSWIQDLLLQSEVKWIKLKEIQALFPNVKEITLEEHAVKFCSLIMEDILTNVDYLNVKTISVHFECNPQILVPYWQQYVRKFTNNKIFLMLHHTKIYIDNVNECEFAMRLIDRMTNGHAYYKDAIPYFNDINGCTNDLIFALVERRANEDQQLLFQKYCAKKRWIYIIWKVLNADFYRRCFRTFFHETHEWIRFDVINKLFTNMTALTVEGVVLCELTMDNILDYIHNRNEKWIHIECTNDYEEMKALVFAKCKKALDEKKLSIEVNENWREVKICSTQGSVQVKIEATSQ
eukprot:263451_1